ncbi:hypothetical protein C0995_002395 [Termitomyces sp. Mi166|nr:hypothetical protein C0995_002395 [Termitomyces sp. Mi166\
MVEFAINASMSETTEYALFELNSGYMPSMIKELRSDEVIHKGIKDFMQTALTNLANAHDAIIKAHVFQMRQANDCRSSKPDIAKGSLVYLSTKNLNLPKGRSNDALFPNRAMPGPYDFSAADDQEWFVDDLLGHRWNKQGHLEFEVRWSLGDTTWEPLASCKDLAALDRYLVLQGMKCLQQLA